jgi:hypothetical protein
MITIEQFNAVSFPANSVQASNASEWPSQGQSKDENFSDIRCSIWFNELCAVAGARWVIS